MGKNILKCYVLFALNPILTLSRRVSIKFETIYLKCFCPRFPNMVLKSSHNAEEPPKIFTTNGKKRTITDRQSCKRLKLEPTKDQVEDVNKQEEPSVEAPKPSSKNINKKRKRDAIDEEPLHSEVSNKEKYEVERVGPRLHSGEAGPPLHPYLKTRAKTDRGEGGSFSSRHSMGRTWLFVLSQSPHIIFAFHKILFNYFLLTKVYLEQIFQNHPKVFGETKRW